MVQQLNPNLADQAMLTRADDICKETSDAISALNALEINLNISDPALFLKLLALDSFKLHVVTLVDRMYAFFLFANTPASNLGLILAQKRCLKNLLPYLRNFIISRFIANCSWDNPEAMTTDIPDIVPSKLNHINKLHLERGENGKIYTLYDEDKRRQCTLEFSDLGENIQVFDMRAAKIKISATSKRMFLIIFLRERSPSQISPVKAYMKTQKRSLYKFLLGWLQSTTQKDTLRDVISKFIISNGAILEKMPPEAAATKQPLDQVESLYEERLSERTFYTGLAIDGDVLNSVPCAYVLAKLEEATGSRIADLFDVISGSSFGALVGLGLVGTWDDQNPCMSPSKYFEALYENAQDIFANPAIKPPHLDRKRLQKFFSTHYRRIPLSSALTRFVLPCLQITKSGTSEIVTPLVFDSSLTQRDPRYDLALEKIASYATMHLPYYAPEVEDPIS